MQITIVWELYKMVNVPFNIVIGSGGSTVIKGSSMIKHDFSCTVILQRDRHRHADRKTERDRMRERDDYSLITCSLCHKLQ